MRFPTTASSLFAGYEPKMQFEWTFSHSTWLGSGGLPNVWLLRAGMAKQGTRSAVLVGCILLEYPAGARGRWANSRAKISFTSQKLVSLFERVQEYSRIRMQRHTISRSVGKSRTQEATELALAGEVSDRPVSLPLKDVACVDLFCGAGGLTHGLLSAGVTVVAGVDFAEECRHPYEANHEGIQFHLSDIATLEPSKLDEWLAKATVRVLAGCAPCQPFSNYALRYQKEEVVEDDERWSLLDHFGRLVSTMNPRPDIVTMENVPAVTKHAVFKRFKSTLERLGYKVWVKVIDCAEYGLPQRRRRTVLLASLYGEIKLRDSTASERRTVEDVIKRLPVLRHGATDKADRLHCASRLSELNYERIQHSTPGGTWRDWPKRLVAACHQKSTGKTYPGVYGRMRYDEPAPTLTTQFYGFGNGRFGHPTQARGISLREGALLQGFPPDYSFIPDDEPIQFKALGRMIGNAVPVDLGRVIGESIIAHVAQHCDAFTKNLKQNVNRPSLSGKRQRGRNDREHEGSAVIR